MREKTSSDFDGKDKKYRLTSILTIKIVNFVVNDKKKKFHFGILSSSNCLKE
jgi:hypothetical protein